MTEPRLYTTDQVRQIVGCSYRMVDYLVRQGLVTPEVTAHGQGSQRLFTWAQVLEVAVLVRCRQAGIYTRLRQELLRNGRQEVGPSLTLVLNGSALRTDIRTRAKELGL